MDLNKIQNSADKVSVVCLIIVLFLVSPVTHADHLDPGEGERPFVFGFLPAFNTEKLVTNFEPLVDYVSDRLGLVLRLETAPDFPEFVRRTQEEKRYDLLFTAPHMYFIANRDVGYRAVVRVKGQHLNAVFVSLKTETAEGRGGLVGKQIATNEPLALTTTLARDYIVQQGLDPDSDLDLVYTPSHDASLQALLRQRTDIAILPKPFYMGRVPLQLRDQTRVLFETAGVPHMPISVAPWVSEGIADKVKDILLTMHTTPEGQVILKKIGWKGFVEPATDEYEGLDIYSKYIDLRKVD
jgi:phosphonate transport system substrate-binding protein